MWGEVMLVAKGISKTINNIKIAIYIHRLKKEENLSLVHSNINIAGLPNNDFPVEDYPTYIYTSGLVYKRTRKFGRFL